MKLGVFMYLGIDFGMKRVGLAVAPEGGPAAPFGVIEWGKGTPFPDAAAVLNEVLRIAAKEGATRIIVGFPSLGSLASKLPQKQWRQEVERFVEALRQTSSIPVQTEDERMSTKLAKRLTGYKGVAEQDAVAAAVILDGFIERMRNKPFDPAQDRES